MISPGCSPSAKIVFLEDWEIIQTAPDYPGCYIIHVKNWQRAQDRLKELRGELKIEHADSTDFTLYPSVSGNYYVVRKKLWGNFLKEVEKLKAQIKLKNLDATPEEEN